MTLPLLRWMLAGCVVMLCACDREASPLETGQRPSGQETAATQPAKTSSVVYRFGFDLRTSPQEDARQYLPFLDYLERSTGYAFELNFSKDGEALIDALGAGQVQFAAVGAVGFLHAQQRYGARVLARGLNQQGRSEYRSYIVVAPDSAIQQLAELRGKRFAFGSITSTQGHLIPRIMLRQVGIGLDDLASVVYTGSHQNCANAVVARQAEACGMQDTLAEELAEQGLIRILHRSVYYPSSGIVAGKDVPESVIAKVSTALLDFDPQGKDAAGLYHWDQTEMPRGLTAAVPGDYQSLAAAMRELGLLGEE